MYRYFLTLTFVLSGFHWAAAQKKTNYDETKVIPYTLPEVLKTQSGKNIKSVSQWEKIRRPEVLKVFESEVYGKTPITKLPATFTVISEDRNALGGKAIRKEIKICFSDDEAHCASLLLFLPSNISKPVPIFLGLNFEGNHAVHADPGITLNTRWMRRTDIRGVKNHLATEESRGSLTRRWEVEEIVANGYGLATVYQGDFELDKPDRSGNNGIRSLFTQKDQPEQWGSIGVWAWGLSRAMDYLETDKEVNAKQVAVMGHSRLGKAALWAAAQDKRFSLVISNNSGEGGASISRRNFGETIADLNRAVNYWFTPAYKKYNDDPSQLPVDSHLLIALIAPRPIYVASASEDLWADPLGEYLGLHHALPAYGLYGKKGMTTNTPPPVGEAVMNGQMGYHNRQGAHDVTLFDWKNYIEFANRHFKK